MNQDNSIIARLERLEQSQESVHAKLDIIGDMVCCLTFGASTEYGKETYAFQKIIDAAGRWRQQGAK